ncbi:hypothetical protein HID58_075192 [Brassica napus]|uniref:Replication factor A C-terminal domain-containing protein n=1 Tax=Brassica napus TaxID=3708 RepID=A0ABQ7YM47_BRANA|nr:hypothetical protein HID58_075192 [Brassica napus]
MKRVFFSDLKSGGKCSSVVEARLLRYWEAWNVKRGSDLMWVDMLLIDVNSTIMQATIYANRLPRFRSKLAAGKVFSISGFDVARCAQNYRLTDSPLLLRFSDLTDFDELAEPVSPLPQEGFRFRNHSELAGLANRNTQLPEIIGEITAVKSTVNDTLGEKDRIMATIKLDNDTKVILSLFDAQAVSFHKKLEDMNGDPMEHTSTLTRRPPQGRFTSTSKSISSQMSTYSSIYSKLPDLVARDTGVPSAAPLLKGYAKVETLTVAELNNFITSATSQEIDFICTGKVVRLDVDKGWCYVTCAKCSKKLQRTVSALECTRCNNTNAVGVLRYRVELAIADDTAEGVFVCFDGVMTKLHNLRASEAGQMLAEGVNPEDAVVPPFITDMEGKTFTFQVRVSAYNFTAHHQTFTIIRILNEHECIPVPNFVVNGGDDADDDDTPDVREPPSPLRDLLDSPSFRPHIRVANSLLSFTSMGATVDQSVTGTAGPFSYRVHGQIIHRIGSLLPNNGKLPEYLQLYIFDTGRYISACEASWRIFAFPIHYNQPNVVKLPLHLPGQHRAVFDQSDDLAEFISREDADKTMLTAFFKACNTYEEARELTYIERRLKRMAYFGDGDAETIDSHKVKHDDGDQIIVDESFLIPKSDFPHEVLASAAYPNFLHNYRNKDYLRERAVLTPTNSSAAIGR